MDKTMVSVPVEPTEAMLKAAHAAMLSDIPPDGESTYGPTISTHAIYRAYWAAMLSAAPAPQPVQGEGEGKWKAIIAGWQARAEAAGYEGVDGVLEAVAPAPAPAESQPQVDAYAAANPLGGVATMFEVMASRIRLGESYASVLDDYGLQPVAAPGDVDWRVKQLREAIEVEDSEAFGYASCGGRAYSVRDNLLCIVGLIEAALRSQGQADAVDEYEFEVWQGGAWQAGGSTQSAEDAVREAGHYAMMYGQDGPVELRYYAKRDITAALAQQANKEQPPNT